ncbi:uncharacterized protein LOC110688933 [Chenopodium quinoa]|uniref:uncharacterized protein LOC110688933 n=1 Tax=Chenopodium quinoa TaxID=63459 RepID=UPI000B7955E1|nr:uncharacterized protein LOC110688933 [Chenopodium quinoa]
MSTAELPLKPSSADCIQTWTSKRIAKSTIDNADVPEEIRDPLEKKLEAMSITFDDDDVNNINREHEDSLVISLVVGNCLLRRVQVDGGSSANVLFKRAMGDMGLKDSDITRRSTTLVGFSGESMSTLGDITLPTYAGSLNPQTKFNIVDCPSAYNAILGQPWIHRLKAIPSTYYQSIKFPTPWGVQEIKGEPREAKHCYKTTLKPTMRTA